METAKKSKSKPKEVAGQIREHYREYLLAEGKTPTSVFLFCKKIGLKEDEFYECFGSFEAIEKSIWSGYLATVKSKLEGDQNYAKFTAREKILSFYFSLTEVLRADRSFVLFQLQGWKNPAPMPAFVKGFRKSFEDWASAVLAEGKASGEIARRPYLDQQYQHVWWLHLLFILQFWAKDDSAGFEKTDVAIEKSVNLAFDFIGKGLLDSTLDFGKFLFQNSRD